MTTAQSNYVAGTQMKDWVALSLIFLFALALRIVFFTGFFGSDEVTYTERAVAWLLGDRSIPEYVGANRLGITLPVAAIMGIFGRSEFTANLWSLACAMGELVLVWFVAMRLGGRTLAIAATLLLAMTPLHIHYSGRLMADIPVSFFMTLSAAAILLGRNDRYWGAVISGAAAGCVFWIKPPVVIFTLAILALMMLERRPLRHYLVWGFAAACVVAMNFAMMWIYAGDPFFILKAMSSRLGLVVAMDDIDKRAHAYLVWLFVDMRFTWLLGWFALLGLFLGYRQVELRLSTLKVLVWLSSLILVFSLWPASLKPIDLIFKQSNYMTLFLAPATISGGLLVSLSKPFARAAMMITYCAGGLFFAALQQADIQTFSANARAMPDFIKQQPDSTFYIGTAGRMAVSFEKVLTANNLDDMRSGNIKPLSEASLASVGEPAMIILDPISGPYRRDLRISEDWPNAKCWRPAGTIHPDELGFMARTAVWFVRATLSALPIAALQTRAQSFMAMPPVFVLKIDTQCEFEAPEAPSIN